MTYYVDASLLGVGLGLAKFRDDIFYPGGPGCTVQPSDKDEDWIPVVAAAGWVVLMRDRRIRTRYRERQALLDGELRSFCLTQSGNSSKWDILKLLVRHWGSIERVATTEPGPYIYAVTQSGVKPLSVGEAQLDLHV